jgi:PAS domain S-box-containing protein
LKESEEKYRTILQSIEEGYYEVDLAGNLTFFNDSLCRTLGYPKDELIGMNNRQYTDQETAKSVYQTFNRVYNTGQSEKGFAWELIKKGGVKRHVEVSVSLVKNASGKKKGFRGIVRDVTERKRIEEELRIHRDHLEELVKERTAELVEANERLKQEIEARRHAEKQLMKYRDHLEELVEQRTEQLTTANKQLQKEINERERAEQEAIFQQEQLFQASKMASLGTLVSGVAHEINNPISFVMLNGPILQKAWGAVKPILDAHHQANGDFEIANMSYTQFSERVPLLISGITEGARRVKTIVSDLKEFARQSPPELKDTVNVNRTVKKAVGLVSNLVKKSTNYFSQVYEPDVPPVKGNIQRIEQVIVNLLVNACQALTDTTQAITVSTTYDSGSNRALVQIRDEGEGISPEALERIKDPFFTTKRDKGGTGLGLAISEKIIIDHGGTMTFNSVLGQGTSVRISLPVHL